MRTPSFLSIMMCVLDVAFNYVFIYIFRLGVTGAALGTMCAYVVTVVPMARQAIWKNRILALRLDTTKFVWVWDYVRNAMKISLPIAVQSMLMSGAQVVSTLIVAPLGNAAIAANSFAITAESLCYMPGYGIGDAASTLVGQTFGAGRRALCHSFARMTIGVGMAVMAVMGLIMFVFAFSRQLKRSDSWELRCFASKPLPNPSLQPASLATVCVWVLAIRFAQL